MKHKKSIITIMILILSFSFLFSPLTQLIKPVDATQLFTPPQTRQQALVSFVKTHTYGSEGEISIAPELDIPSLKAAYYSLEIFETIGATYIDPTINISSYSSWVASLQSRTSFSPSYGGFTYNIEHESNLENCYYGTKALGPYNQLHRLDKNTLAAWFDHVQITSIPTWGWTNISEPTISTNSFVIEVLYDTNKLGNLTTYTNLTNWILDSQNSNGGFGIRANETSPSLMNTYYAILSLDHLESLTSINTTLVTEYVLSHQLEDGGFASEGEELDLASTYWAIETLSILDNLSSVENSTNILNWLLELQQEEGGFSYYKDSSYSYLSSSFYVVKILSGLDFISYLSAAAPWESLIFSISEILILTLIGLFIVGIVFIVYKVKKTE
ncbi:MAG: prenyltransferase/squalene oxidase repeat-containing protein [Candidatus Ranarchaeia archaeon]